MRSFLLLVILGIGAATPLKKYEGSTTRTYIVTLREDTAKILDSIETKTFTSRTERVGTVAQALMTHAAKTQAEVHKFIDETNQIKSKQANPPLPVKFEPLWISNQLILKNAPADLLHQLEERDDIESIEESQPIQIEPIDEESEIVYLGRDKQLDPTIQWGVERINSKQVWDAGNKGEGALVAVIDTGVNGFHDALKNSYVGNDNFGWLDPDGKSKDPVDHHSHGTHCAGSIAGTIAGIGVAPGAKWMACRTNNATEKMESHLIKQCLQWALCPSSDSNDCKAPHIVSNSWGGGQGTVFYESEINAWRSAGIIPIFANGNSGPLCGSANSPADNPKVIAVGNTNKEDEVYVSAYPGSSSVGPPRRLEYYFNPYFKPDISAPGTDIYSAANSQNDGYLKKTGTSMACPHTAGAVALLVSASGGNLDYDRARNALINGVERTRASKVISEQKCGGKTATQFPNHYVGYGRINIQKSIEWLKNN